MFSNRSDVTGAHGFFTSAKEYVYKHFNPKTAEGYVNINRAYNALVAGFVTLGYFTTDNANAYEYGIDIAIHVFQAWTSGNTNNLMKYGTVGVNLYRFLDIYYRGVKNISTVPLPLNYLDLFNHAYNISANTVTIASDQAESAKLKI